MKHGAPPSHLAAKTVLAAFALAVAVFGAVLLLPLLLPRLLADRPVTEADAPSGRVREYTLLFRRAEGELTGAVRLTSDTRLLTLTATGYAPTWSAAEGKPTLETLFREQGEAAASAALGPSDSTLTFSVSSVAGLIVYLGDNLPYTLPEPLGLLPSGAVTLTPMQTADILRYRQWENGDTGQAAAHAGVVAAIFNRYLTEDRDFEADFAKLTELCDSRLHISEFVAIHEGLKTLAAANDGHLCTPTTA